MHFVCPFRKINWYLCQISHFRMSISCSVKVISFSNCQLPYIYSVLISWNSALPYVRTFSHWHITHFLMSMSWSVNCKLISFTSPPLLYIHFQVEHVNIIPKFASLACPFPDRASWNRCQIFQFCVSFFLSCNMNNCSIFMNFLYSVSWCSLLFHHIINFSHPKKKVNGRLLWFFKVKMNNHLTYEAYSKQGN